MSTKRNYDAPTNNWILSITFRKDSRWWKYSDSSRPMEAKIQSSQTMIPIKCWKFSWQSSIPSSPQTAEEVFTQVIISAENTTLYIFQNPADYQKIILSSLMKPFARGDVFFSLVRLIRFWFLIISNVINLFLALMWPSVDCFYHVFFFSNTHVMKNDTFYLGTKNSRVFDFSYVFHSPYGLFFIQE